MTRFGIEYELEVPLQYHSEAVNSSEALINLFSEYIPEDTRIVLDGSLRGIGCEIVSPILSNVEAAASFATAIAKVKARVKKEITSSSSAASSRTFFTSGRTGLHIHFSQSDWGESLLDTDDPVTISRFLLSMLVIESYVMLSGYGRFNNFTQLEEHTKEMAYTLATVGSGYRFSFGISSHAAKYRGINISSLSNLGTVEIRCLKSTLGHKQQREVLEVVDYIASNWSDVGNALLSLALNSDKKYDQDSFTFLPEAIRESIINKVLESELAASASRLARGVHTDGSLYPLSLHSASF